MAVSLFDTAKEDLAAILADDDGIGEPVTAVFPDGRRRTFRAVVDRVGGETDAFGDGFRRVLRAVLTGPAAMMNGLRTGTTIEARGPDGALEVWGFEGVRSESPSARQIDLFRQEDRRLSDQQSEADRVSGRAPGAVS